MSPAASRPSPWGAPGGRGPWRWPPRTGPRGCRPPPARRPECARPDRPGTAGSRTARASLCHERSALPWGPHDPNPEVQCGEVSTRRLLSIGQSDVGGGRSSATEVTVRRVPWKSTYARVSTVSRTGDRAFALVPGIGVSSNYFERLAGSTTTGPAHLDLPCFCARPAGVRAVWGAMVLPGPAGDAAVSDRRRAPEGHRQHAGDQRLPGRSRPRSGSSRWPTCCPAAGSRSSPAPRTRSCTRTPTSWPSSPWSTSAGPEPSRSRCPTAAPTPRSTRPVSVR